MAYHERADLVPGRLTELELAQLTDDTGAASVAVDAVWEDLRVQVDAEIDGYVGTRYTVPLSPVPPLITKISVDLVVYELYARRFPEGVPEGIQRGRDRAEKKLRHMAEGLLTLGVQPALPGNSERAAQLVSHTAVFGRANMVGF